MLTYKEYRAKLQSEQSGKTKDEVLDEMKRTSEWVADLDNLPVQEHRWIDRGVIMSCEGGSHPHHQTSKRR